MAEKNSYDEEPVCYCKQCHSLCIGWHQELSSEFWDGSYCINCNSTDIGQCSIEEWIEEEKRREQRRKEIEWNKL